MSKRSRFNKARYLLGAFLYLLRLPLLIATLTTVVYIIIDKSLNSIYLLGGLLSAWVIVNILFFIQSQKVTCRLCRAQFLRNLGCNIKRNAPKIFGSHTLPVALSILTRQERIRCPYCGEKHPYFRKH